MAGPLVRYFLESPDSSVTVADVVPDKAKAMVGRHPRGRAIGLDMADDSRLKKEVESADIVVSLVPNAFHPLIARICVDLKKNMVNASYVSEAMNDLDDEARNAGVVILNEVGLDPGIDHMEAMRVIQQVKAGGGKILGFTSYCGGLPAPEANTNPFGYKFSWSPRGVLLAGKSAARYLKGGKEVFVPGEELFENYAMITVPGLGEFEGYPNRNALPYIELYGIPETQTMFRGTLRYPGWCETLKKIGEIGLLDQAEKNLGGMTYQRFVRSILGMPADWNIKKVLRERLKLRPDSKVIERLEWLGLFDEERIPAERGSALDVLENLMLKKLRYDKGERDMIVLRHEFITAGADGSRKRSTSTLIDYGLPDGDSSMARTVGLPAAIAAKMVLEGKIKRTGVLVPVYPEIYGPVLDELAGLGIVFKEEKENGSP